MIIYYFLLSSFLLIIIGSHVFMSYTFCTGKQLSVEVRDACEVFLLVPEYHMNYTSLALIISVYFFCTGGTRSLPSCYNGHHGHHSWDLQLVDGTVQAPSRDAKVSLRRLQENRLIQQNFTQYLPSSLCHMKNCNQSLSKVQ